MEMQLRSGEGFSVSARHQAMLRHTGVIALVLRLAKDLVMPTSEEDSSRLEGERDVREILSACFLFFAVVAHRNAQNQVRQRLRCLGLMRFL